MFTNSQTKIKLEKEIEAALAELEKNRENPEEYNVIVERIARLQKLKSEKDSKLPSPDTMLIVGANLLGILWLSAVERETPISSKALNFVMRPK